MNTRETGLHRLQNFRVNICDPYYLHYKYLFADLKHAAKYGKGDLLDIGCGNKPYQEMFDVDSYFGCDIVQSSDMKTDLICDSLNIPLSDESFDTILSTQVIEHVAEPQKLCSEAYRLLRKGGTFIVSGPMYWHLHEEPYDFYRFTKHGFRYILEKEGFKIIEITSNGGQWALAGQVLIHTFQGTKLQRQSITKLINRTFGWLDKTKFNDVSTLNYVVVARKI